MSDVDKTSIISVKGMYRLAQDVFCRLSANLIKHLGMDTGLRLFKIIREAFYNFFTIFES